MKRIAAIMIASLFVLTAFAVVEMPTAMASTPTQNFSFPYSYGQPQVPSDVGAQGTQGPTVPKSDIGPQVAMPNIVTRNGSPLMVNKSAHVSILVYNGTKTTKSISIGSTVQVLNASFGISFSTVTSKYGYANFTLSIGWYAIVITQASSSYINFSTFTNVKSNESLTYYLIPSSYYASNIGNGPSSTFVTIWDYSPVDWSVVNQPYYGGQLTVELLNASNSNTVLGSAVTLQNGSVEFTDVNNAYSYTVEAIGYNQTLTGVLYDMMNVTGGVGSLSTVTHAHTNAIIINNVIYKSPTVTGTQISSTEYWNIASNTTVQNGSFLLGSEISFNANKEYNLVFKNDTIWFAQTQNYNINNEPLNLSFIDSTVIFLVTVNMFQYVVHGYIYESVIYTGGNAGPYGFNSEATSSFAGKPFVTESDIIGPVVQLGVYPPSHYSVFQLEGNVSYSTVTGVSNYAGGAGGNITHSAIINSTMRARPASLQDDMLNNTIMYFVNSNPTSTVYINNSFLYNSSMEFHKMYISNSTWVFTYFANGIGPSAGGLFGNGPSPPTKGDTVSIIHDYFGFTSEGAPISAINDFNVSITYSYFNLSTPVQQFTISVSNNLSFNNNYIILPNVTELYSFFSSSNVPSFSGRSIFALAASNTTMLHNYIQNVGLDHENGGNLTAEGNLLFDYIPGNAFYDFGSPGDYAYLQRYTISNNTWNGMTFNYRVQTLIANHIYQPYGTKVVFNGNSGLQHVFPYDLYENITYNTFNFMPIGTEYGVNPSSIVWLSDKGAYNIVSHNLFTNSQASVQGNISYSTSVNGIYSSSPFAADIIPSSGLSYIKDNVFENLNNMTVPIVQSASNDVDGWNPITHISGNSFYYQPMKLQSYISDNGPFLTSQLSGSSSTMAYEIPIDLNGTMTGQFSQYVFNTSIQQTNFESNGGTSDSGVTPTVWSWGIAPDVNTLSGTPTISYSNGLVGGPQPNFTWQGYKYSESVEPSYIQVGVNSANAPPVNLQFNGAPNTAYSIAMYDNGQLIDYTNVTSSANGVVTFTYNPATMPLDPVFELTTFHIVTSGSTAVPPEVFLYVLLAGGALLGAGAIIVAAVDRRRYR